MEIICLVTATSDEIVFYHDQIASLSNVYPTDICCIDQQRVLAEALALPQTCSMINIKDTIGDVINDIAFMLDEQKFSLFCSISILENLLEFAPVLLISPHQISAFLSTYQKPPCIIENSISLPGDAIASVEYSPKDDAQVASECLLFSNGKKVRDYISWSYKKINFCRKIMNGSSTPLFTNLYAQKHWHWFDDWVNYAWVFGCERETLALAAVHDAEKCHLVPSNGKAQFDNGTPILNLIRDYYLRDYRMRERCNKSPFTHPELFLEKPCRCGDDHPVPITAPMVEIYSLRDDVRTCFPNLEGDNRLPFIRWFLSHGKREYLLPDQYTLPIKAALFKYTNSQNEDAREKNSIEKSILRFYKTIINPNKACAPAKRSTERRPDGVNLCGFIKGDFGLGEAARILATALSSANIPFTIVSYESIPSHTYTNTEWDDKITNTFPYNTNIMLTNINEVDLLRDEVAPEAFSDRYNIAFWYWELPEFPEEWTPAFNYIDEVWTSSNFTKNSFEHVTEKPVFVVPCCLDESQKDHLTREDFGLPPEPFLFLVMYDIRSTQARKNPEGAIKAFRKAFGDRSDVGLVIKINAPEGWVDYSGLVDELCSHANSYVIIDTFPKPRLNSLISLCDAFVSLHRSEGFGLGPAEAMYWGVPVVLTDWSGNQMYMTDDNCCPVPCKIIEIAESSDFYRKGWHWADPDIDQAAIFMKKLVEDPEYRKEIARKGKDTIRKEFSPHCIGEIASKRLHSIWKKL